LGVIRVLTKGPVASTRRGLLNEFPPISRSDDLLDKLDGIGSGAAFDDSPYSVANGAADEASGELVYGWDRHDLGLLRRSLRGLRVGRVRDALRVEPPLSERLTGCRAVFPSPVRRRILSYANEVMALIKAHLTHWVCIVAAGGDDDGATALGEDLRQEPVE
jgi:hypothetical protein